MIRHLQAVCPACGSTERVRPDGALVQHNEPRHDGSNSAGWTVQTGKEWPVLCTVKPEWLEHHK